MRVAVTLEQCWHEVPGGTAVAALELVRALDARGDVGLVGVSARHARPAPAPWTPPIATRQLWAPEKLLYELWHMDNRLSPRVETATGPVDVVHATAIAYPRADAPVVVTIHDLSFLDDEQHATKHGHRFMRRGTDLARAHAAIVMCSSRVTFDDCIAAGFDADRLRVVPLGVRATPRGPDDVARVRAEFGLDRPYAMFTGTIEPRKNLPRLLRAFATADHHDVDVVLVGPEGWNESIAAEREALGDRVHALGFVDREQRDALLAGAELFCYPSLKEGFGLPVLEAMAQGTPVITSATTSTAEVAGDAARLVDPRDEKEIADAIDEVLDDHVLAARLREAGRARAGQYTWERTAAEVVAVYAEAMAS